jgi:hypothetical protein
MGGGLRPGVRCLGRQQHDPPHAGLLDHLDETAGTSGGGQQVACRNQKHRVGPLQRGARSVGASARSAGTTRALAGTSALVTRRETAVTFSPASASSRASGRPTFPVAPVTTIMPLARHLDEDFITTSGVDGWRQMEQGKATPGGE